MLIITDRRGLESRQRNGAACVLIDPLDTDLLAAVGAALPEAGMVRAVLDGRRPIVHVEDDRISVLVLLGDGWEARRRSLLVASGDLLVVVGDAMARQLAQRAVGGTVTGPAEGLGRALAVLAREAETQLDRVRRPDDDTDLDAAHGLELESNRLVSGDLRRATGRRRARLFEWRQLYALQARSLDDDEPLSQALGDDGRRLLRPARASFQYAADVADRLYAALGDVLSQQDALASQRLTLVSTVFLPLTVTTGFFGMNFGWLTDHIGSPAAFVVFGVFVPVLSVLVSLGVVRRYGV